MGFEEIIETLEQANGLEDWFARLQNLFSCQGFGQTLFALKTNKETPNEEALIQTTYTKKWRNKYTSDRYEDVDPTVEHSLKSSLPILWEPDRYLNEQQAFFEEAGAHGLRFGMTLPLHDPDGRCGLLSLAIEEANEKDAYKGYIRDRLPAALCIRDISLETSKRFFKYGTSKNNLVSLTNREKEVIKWSAVGKTSWEIATILSCSESTVNFHFNNVRRKFNVSSRRQAIIKAIQQKVVTI